MYIIYDILFMLLFSLYIPIFLFEMWKGKYRKGLGERFGFISEDKFKKLAGRPVIWIHSVSVGETVAASPVVKEIKKKYPDHAILFSTVTETGQNMAHKIIKEADTYIYFPFDLSIILKSVFSQIDAELVIIMETELWPNFIREADKRDIRVVLANGRISDSSAKRYKYLGPFLKDMLDKIDLLCMQSEQDLSYIRELGAEKGKTFNTGNTKLDQNYSAVSETEKEHYYQEFKIDGDQPLLVVGSTHPNEEEQFIEVFKDLKKEFSRLIMVVAPRHIKRTEEIKEMYLASGINVICRTEIEERVDEPIILLDTIGELAKIYSIADLVFVGGSLVERGGHNILEPAAHGKLVFFGPNMFNFKESTRILLENNAAIQVKNKEELIEKLKTFLQDSSLLKSYSKNTRAVIEKKQGASIKTVKLLKEIL